MLFTRKLEIDNTLAWQVFWLKRSLHLPVFETDSGVREVAFFPLYSEVSGPLFTATGIAPDLHRFPFSSAFGGTKPMANVKVKNRFSKICYSTHVEINL